MIPAPGPPSRGSGQGDRCSSVSQLLSSGGCSSQAFSPSAASSPVRPSQPSPFGRHRCSPKLHLQELLCCFYSLQHIFVKFGFSFFRCLFLLLAFLLFPIHFLAQFDANKIKPITSFDMKNKPNHTILAHNTGHVKCLGIKKSNSRSVWVNNSFREIYANKKQHYTQKHL